MTDLAIIPLGAGVQWHGWQLGHESGIVGERYVRPAEKLAVLVERFCDRVSEVSGKVLLRIYRARRRANAWHRSVHAAEQRGRNIDELAAYILHYVLTQILRHRQETHVVFCGDQVIGVSREGQA
jgi:hypothetical protein